MDTCNKMNVYENVYKIKEVLRIDQLSLDKDLFERYYMRIFLINIFNIIFYKSIYKDYIKNIMFNYDLNNNLDI